MFGNRFYNETTRKYVSMFGTFFNDIRIYRRDNNDNIVQTINVPIAYGPHQKFLARLQQDPTLSAPAIQLPRMSFQYTNIQYDGERKLTSSFRRKASIESNDGAYSTVLNPTPYNIDFELSIMAKYMDDGTKILEQIIPFFRPEFTPSVKLLDDPEYYLDVPIVLNGVSFDDAYEGSFEERRVLLWILNFTVKGWFFGPTTNKKVIKFVRVNEYDSFEANSAIYSLTVQPGLDANGNPTTDANNTVDYSNINVTDDWAYIVQIEDNT